MMAAPNHSQVVHPLHRRTTSRVPKAPSAFVNPVFLPEYVERPPTRSDCATNRKRSRRLLSLRISRDPILHAIGTISQEAQPSFSPTMVLAIYPSMELSSDYESPPALPPSDSSPPVSDVKTSQVADDPTVDFQEYLIPCLIPPGFLPRLESTEAGRRVQPVFTTIDGWSRGERRMGLTLGAQEPCWRQI